MSDKILVVGATGNVGHTLVELLAKKGESVEAATRQPAAYPKLENVEAVTFDYDRPDTWSAALAEVNRVFLMARNADVEADKVMLPFIDKAKAAGVQHVVLMTAMGVDQAPDDVAYRRVEKYLMASGIPYTILRPNWFMQNFAPGFILPMIQQNSSIFLPAGEAKTSYIDTRDIAAVAAVALTEAGHRGKEYPLTGGEAFSYAEAAKILSEAAGKEISYVAISDEDLAKGLAEAGWTEGQIGMMTGLFYTVRQGWAASVVPTVAEVLGREPITLKQYAQDHAEAWQ